MMRAFHISDLVEVNGWLTRHGRPRLDSEDIPNLGAIIPGVACGFVVSTDTDTVFIEGFITNPEASSELRGAAVTEIGNWAIEVSRKLGAKGAMIITREDSLAERALDLGFKFIKAHVGVLTFR